MCFFFSVFVAFFYPHPLLILILDNPGSFVGHAKQNKTINDTLHPSLPPTTTTTITTTTTTKKNDPRARTDISSTGIPGCHRIYCDRLSETRPKSMGKQSTCDDGAGDDDLCGCLVQNSRPTLKLASWDRR